MKNYPLDKKDSASVPKKGKGPAVPNQHWEMRYNMAKPNEYMLRTSDAAFVPQIANTRKTTQKKVNKEDH